MMVLFVPKGMMTFPSAIRLVGDELVEGWNKKEIPVEAEELYDAKVAHKIKSTFDEIYRRARAKKPAINHDVLAFSTILDRHYSGSWAFLNAVATFDDMCSNREWASLKNYRRNHAGKGSHDDCLWWSARYGDVEAVLKISESSEGLGADRFCSSISSRFEDVDFRWMAFQVHRLFAYKQEKLKESLEETATTIESYWNETVGETITYFKNARVARELRIERIISALGIFMRLANAGEVRTEYKDRNGRISILPDYWATEMAEYTRLRWGFLPDSADNREALRNASPRYSYVQLREELEAHPLFVDCDGLAKSVAREKRVRAASSAPGRYSKTDVREWFRDRQLARPERHRPIEEHIADAREAFPGLSIAEAKRICTGLYQETGAKWSTGGRPRTKKTPA